MTPVEDLLASDSMTTVEDLLASLASEHPEDAEDLVAALDSFRREKLTSVGRLARLNDAQWARLGLSLGVESLVRDAIQFASPEDSTSPPRQSPPPRPSPPVRGGGQSAAREQSWEARTLDSDDHHDAGGPQNLRRRGVGGAQKLGDAYREGSVSTASGSGRLF